MEIAVFTTIGDISTILPQKTPFFMIIQGLKFNPKPKI